MTTGLVVSVTDELVAELEALAGECGQHGTNWYEPRHMAAFPEYACDQDFVVAASPAKLLSPLAERAELRRVIADVKWRVADTTDQLQATDFDGDRRYGLDEWSGPIKNLNMAIGILEKALESKA